MVSLHFGDFLELTHNPHRWLVDSHSWSDFQHVALCFRACTPRWVLISTLCTSRTLWQHCLSCYILECDTMVFCSKGRQIHGMIAGLQWISSLVQLQPLTKAFGNWILWIFIRPSQPFVALTRFQWSHRWPAVQPMNHSWVSHQIGQFPRYGKVVWGFYGYKGYQDPQNLDVLTGCLHTENILCEILAKILSNVTLGVRCWVCLTINRLRSE